MAWQTGMAGRQVLLMLNGVLKNRRNRTRHQWDPLKINAYWKKHFCWIVYFWLPSGSVRFGALSSLPDPSPVNYQNWVAVNFGCGQPFAFERSPARFSWRRTIGTVPPLSRSSLNRDLGWNWFVMLKVVTSVLSNSFILIYNTWTKQSNIFVVASHKCTWSN